MVIVSLICAYINIYIYILVKNLLGIFECIPQSYLPATTMELFVFALWLGSSNNMPPVELINCFCGDGFEVCDKHGISI